MGSFYPFCLLRAHCLTIFPGLGVPSVIASLYAHGSFSSFHSFFLVLFSIASTRLEDKICTKERRDAADIYKKYRDGAIQRDRNRFVCVGVRMRALFVLREGLQASALQAIGD
jgi:hypothetical protein